MKILFDTYGSSKLASKAINEETSDILNILQELEGKFTEDVKLIGLEPWVAKLKLRNDAMSKLMTDRYNETATKNTVVVKEARAELDKVYSAITERIYALSVVKDLIERPTDYSVFVNTLLSASVLGAYRSNPSINSAVPSIDIQLEQLMWNE